jgi:hypothetical protein
MLGVEDLDVADGLDVACGDHAGTLLAHNHALGFVAFHADGDFLDVQYDVGDIFAHARDRGEFVQHAVDLHRGDGSAAQRGQKHATQALPSVRPKPRSSGSATTVALVRPEVLNSTLLGLINSCQFF